MGFNLHRYDISSTGVVIDLKRNRFLRGRKGRNGFTIVDLLTDDGTWKTFSIHILVAQQYLERPEGAHYVHHKDGNKSNNCVDNLEWL